MSDFSLLYGNRSKMCKAVQLAQTLYNDDDCLGNDLCHNFHVTSGSDYILYITLPEREFNVSDVHGSCGEGEIYNYGLQCVIGYTCPDCINYNVFTGEGFQRFSPHTSDDYKVGYVHEGCKDQFNNCFDFGLTCTPNVDCPDCITFKTFREEANGFDIYSPKEVSEYKVGYIHSSCALDPADYPYGLQCTPDVDCPDCNMFKTFNGTSEFSEYIVGGLANASYPDIDLFPDLDVYPSDGSSGNLYVGYKNGSCAQNDANPYPIDPGLDCYGVDPCPPCADFRTWDGEPAINHESNYDSFVSQTANFISSSLINGGCGSGAELNFGLQCTIGVDCTPCVQYKTLNDLKDGFVNFGDSSDLYHVGSESESCASFNPPPGGGDWGLQCTVGVDCPDCIQYNTLKEDGTSFEVLNTSDGYLKVGYEYGSCSGLVAPSSPLNVLATTDQEVTITITWDESLTGVPVPTYDIYREDELIKTNAISPYVDSVDAGTYLYKVYAINEIGSAVNQDSGTALAGTTTPSIPTDFNASDDEIGQVTVTWTNSTDGDPVPTYDLYEESIQVAVDITSGYTHTVSEGIKDYFIRATNTAGHADSVVDSGESLSVRCGFFVNVYGEPVFDAYIVTGSDQYMILR